MKHTIFIIGFAFLFTLVLLLIIEKKRINRINTDNEYTKNRVNNIFALYNEAFDNFIQYDNIPVTDIDLIDNNGKTDQLANIVGKGKLVIYLPKIECFSCSDKEIEALHTIFSEKDRANIILISNFSSIRELKIFEQNSSLKSYDIQVNYKFPVEELMNKTTLLYISENMTGSCVFVSDKSQNKLSEIYYHAMLKKIHAQSKE
jgi:hypothetical protein